ncbi:MAG: peptide ABC transporter substrate-binding protein [Aliidongia sp.]
MNRIRSLFLAAFCLLAAPASADTVLARWLSAEPDSLDPQRTTSQYSVQVDQDLFEGLVRFDRDKHPIPGVAERWEMSPDGLTYTFHLRSDAIWSNGEKLTAEDFVYGFRRLVDPKTAAADIEPARAIANAEAIVAGKIADPAALGVAAPDAQTFVITLAHPQAVELSLLQSRFAYPLHRATIERWGNEWTRPEHMVSNGPYVLKSWVPHDEIVLTRNPGYYGRDGIAIGTVRHVVSDDDGTAFRRWQAGELDTCFPPTREIPTLHDRFGDQLHRAPSRQVWYLSINMQKPPLGTDPRLREALSLTIDRETLTGKIYARGEAPAYSYVPPMITGYTPQTVAFEALSKPERVARAKRLLQEAGYGPDHPLAVEISYGSSDETRTVLAAIAQMWKTTLGVETTLSNQEFQVYLQAVATHNFQIGALGYNVDYDDAGEFLRLYRSDGGFNVGSFADPTYDALLATAGSALDLAKRRDALQQAEHLLMTAMPILPVYFGSENMLVAKRVQGWIDNDRFTETRFLSVRE